MRLLLGLVIAALVNLGLFTLMHFMTTTDRVERKTFEDIHILDFVRMKEEPHIETKQRQLPDKPKPPEKTPPPPKMLQQAQEVKSPKPRLSAPNIKVPLNIDGVPYLGGVAGQPAPMAASPNVSEYAQVAPLVRIPPRYPRSASRRGIEGSVRVAFTITKDGVVTNARVLKADPPGVFDKAALRAIKKWKFAPKIIDGQAVEQKAAQEIKFKMPK